MVAEPRCFESFPAGSADMSTDDVLARLAARAEVAGVVSLGSTASGRHAASDVDLLVVLVDGPDLAIEFSFVDGRPADIVFTNLSTMGAVAAPGPDPVGRHADLRGWLAAGRVEFSRANEIEAAVAAAARAGSGVADDRERFFRWVELNVNLIKLRRYASASGEPHYEAGLDLLLDRAFAELPHDIQVSHGVRWTGERDAARWLHERHPDVWATITSARHEADPRSRLAAYESAAAVAAAPAGGLWPDGETAGRWDLAGGQPPSRWEQLIVGPASRPAGHC